LRAFLCFHLALTGTGEHAQAAFFNGMFDGIVISHTMIETKYHTMFFWQFMVSKIDIILILKCF